MAILNEYNNNTKNIIHILITEKCNRNCKYCCNKQYNMNLIPKVSDQELKEAHTLCLTGGEPFAFCDPCAIAEEYKRKYPNIKKIYVYTNAVELAERLITGYHIHNIDGVNISIKNRADAQVFDNILKLNSDLLKLESNLIYVFNNLYPTDRINGYTIIPRVWQKEFVPATDSIFRKM